MTAEDVKYLHDKLKEISTTLNVSVSLFLHSDTEYHVAIYGCPACTVNAVKDWLSENDMVRHTAEHKNILKNSLN